MSDEPSGHLCCLIFKSTGKNTRSSKTSTSEKSIKQKMDQSEGYCGLEKQGSTCYLNSVLQTLFMTKKFREHVTRLDKDGVSSDGNLAKELNKLFNKLETQQKKPVSTTGITKSLGIGDAKVHKQRDAADLLHLILEKTPGSSELFKGTMKTTKTCRTCKDNPQETPEDFLSLTFPFEQNQDVEDALQAYAHENSLCVHCRIITVMETKREMMKFPERMIINLKRSETTCSTHLWSKSENDQKVNIRAYIKISSHNYELYAIVNSSKTHQGVGCYYADIKCENQIWCRFEDSNVSESPLNNVFSKESSPHRSSEACLLMYRRREQTAGDTGEDQRNKQQRSMMPSDMTQRHDAGKMEKTNKPREGHFQSHSVNTDSSDNKRRYCGLENQGSTCYLNSVLQTLFMTKKFREHVTRLDKDGVSSDGNLAKELNKLFSKLETQEKKYVSTTGITKSLGIRDVYKQRDAAEFLHLILEKTPGSSELFKGTMKTTKTCRTCKDNPQETPEDFLSLTFPFEQNQDVEDALKAYVDQMCAEYQLYCFHCKEMTDWKKNSKINFPKLLIIQLRRFEMISYGLGYRKNDLEVNIHPQIKHHKYELYAIINHFGSYHGGHYNADIKCEDEIWRRFNDCFVSESPLNNVFSKESSAHRSSEACLLMYRCREQTGDTGEDQRNAEQQSMMVQRAEMEKTKNPREGHSQSYMDIDSSDNKGRYCGLEKQGSTCYLNSVLQTLFMTKKFREHVTRLDKDGVSSDGNLAKELNKLFYKLETQQKKPVSTTGITKSLGIRDVYKQRDAAEFLHLILEKTPGSSELFKGTMKTTKTCRTCKDNPQETSEDFYSFQMSLQNSQDVEDAFQAHVNRMREERSGVHCGKIREIETKIEIKFPKHLIVETKNSTYMLRSSKNDMQVIIRPHIKVLCNEYELYAVVNYNSAGHYNADIRCKEEIWHRFEDSNVSESPLNNVFSKESSPHRSSEACLLMYRRREQSQQSQFQTEVHHQGLEADKTRERDLFSSQADNQELIKQVQEDVHGVTCEEAEWALRRNQWDFTHAVQQLKVNQLFNADLGSQEECKQTLILFHWNLEKASNALTRQGRDTYVKKQF